MIPGEYILKNEDIICNENKKVIVVEVGNKGDRPIQVGSHYHFFEVNNFLHFDREKALGYRLNIISGTAVRFEPGQTRTVELVELSGLKKIFGFQGKVMGDINEKN